MYAYIMIYWSFSPFTVFLRQSEEILSKVL